jgi:SAM-dependent methyltransferase
LTGSLVKYAGLTVESRLLEIGSGAGRIPYSLEGMMLGPGRYTGLDVDRVSIEACRSSQTLTDAGFTFIHADLDSDLYNSGGRGGTAASYRFPFDDEAFDIVYLESVFTHLTGEECANYAKEILRVLKAGGRAVVSGFLRDLGMGDSSFTFRHQVGDVYVEYSDNPRKAVAFDTETVTSWFGRPYSQRLRGSWRGDAGEYPNGQDWLVMTK